MSPPPDRPVVSVGGASGGGSESLGAAPRRLPRPVAAGLVVLALLVLAAVLADGPLRSNENSVLAERAQAARLTIDFTDRRIAGTVQYASPQLTSASALPAVQADLRRLVQDTAAERVQPLRDRRDAIAQTRVAPWHSEQRAARRALLSYLDERLRLLEAVSASLRVLYEPRPELARLRDRAATALTEAGVDGPVLAG